MDLDKKTSDDKYWEDKMEQSNWNKIICSFFGIEIRQALLPYVKTFELEYVMICDECKCKKFRFIVHVPHMSETYEDLGAIVECTECGYTITVESDGK
jgi:hypothetical protein